MAFGLAGDALEEAVGAWGEAAPDVAAARAADLDFGGMTLFFNSSSLLFKTVLHQDYRLVRREEPANAAAAAAAAAAACAERAARRVVCSHKHK